MGARRAAQGGFGGGRQRRCKPGSVGSEAASLGKARARGKSFCCSRWGSNLAPRQGLRPLVRGVEVGWGVEAADAYNMGRRIALMFG